jgi:hypothetical protein
MADDTCAIEGTLSDAEIVVRLPRGMRRVRVSSPQRVVITPLRPGIAHVRTLDGEEIEGTTRARLSYVMARPIALREGALELPVGLPIERLDVAPRGPWAVVAVSLGDGLFLRGAQLPCSAITLATTETVIVPRAPLTETGPSWRARTERLYFFGRPEGDAFLRVDSAPESSARLIEIERASGWVHLVYHTALGARLRAWVRDTSLVR